MRELSHQRDLRLGQAEMFRSLAAYRATFVLAAPGLGKSFALQSVVRCCAGFGMISVVVVNLRALVVETCAAFRLANIKTITATVTGDVEMSDTIQPQQPRVIVVGSEQFVTQRLRATLSALAGRDQLGLVAIDEATAAHDAHSYRDVTHQYRNTIEAIRHQVALLLARRLFVELRLSRCLVRCVTSCMTGSSCSFRIAFRKRRQRETIVGAAVVWHSASERCARCRE